MTTAPGSSRVRMWRTTLPFLWRTLWSHKPASLSVVGVGVLAGGIATVKSLIEAQVINAVVDAVESGTSDVAWSDPLDPISSDGTDWATSTLRWVLDVFDLDLTLGSGIATYLVISALAALLMWASTATRETLSRGLFADLFETGVSRAFSRQTVDRVEEPGGVAGAVQQGASSVAGAYALLVEACQQFFVLLTVLAVLWGFDILFAGICLAVTLTLAGLSYAQGKHLQKRREKFDQRRRELFAASDDVLVNRDVLAAHERKDEYVTRLRQTSHELATIDKNLSVRESWYAGGVNFTQDVGQIVILLVVLVYVAQGIDLGEVGQTYFYVSLFARLMVPIRQLLSGYDSVRRSMSVSDTLVELLQQTDDRPAREETINANPEVAAEFTDVDFEYVSAKTGKRRVVLQRCSFTVPRGGVTLVVGRSGSGKTTIARLLLGFLWPGRGQVQVFGKATELWDHADLLEEMSFLSQTGHVVSGTVAENLFVRPPEGPEEVPAYLARLASAVTRAGLARDRDPYDVLELTAKELSEGQKQRLALARILVDEEPIAILDEPLAGIDAFTFQEVREEFSTWLSDPARTVVLISHRLSFVSDATHVVMLGDDGSVHQGSPQELAAQRGVFASLLETARREFA